MHSNITAFSISYDLCNPVNKDSLRSRRNRGVGEGGEKESKEKNVGLVLVRAAVCKDSSR